MSLEKSEPTNPTSKQIIDSLEDVIVKHMHILDADVDIVIHRRKDWKQEHVPLIEHEIMNYLFPKGFVLGLKQER